MVVEMWQSSNIQKCGICSQIQSHLTKVTSLFWFPIRSMMSRWHGQMKHSYQLVASSPHHCSDWMWRAKYVYGVRPYAQHSSCESGWNRRSWQCSQNLCRPLFIEVKHYCIKPPFSGIAHLLYCPPLELLAPCICPPLVLSTPIWIAHLWYCPPLSSIAHPSLLLPTHH